MIPLSVAALTNARKSGFSALIFTDVKTFTGNLADYKQITGAPKRPYRRFLTYVTRNLR